MIVKATRFADQMGPHCPARSCTEPVVRAGTGSAFHLFNVEPDQNGDHKLVDTGGQQPFARKLLTAQRFGHQGQLHSRHDQGCAAYKRWKREQK